MYSMNPSHEKNPERLMSFSLAGPNLRNNQYNPPGFCKEMFLFYSSLCSVRSRNKDIQPLPSCSKVSRWKLCLWWKGITSGEKPSAEKDWGATKWTSLVSLFPQITQYSQTIVLALFVFQKRLWFGFIHFLGTCSNSFTQAVHCEQII